LLNRKEVGRAIEAYTESLRKDPQNVEARMSLGLSLGISGNHERARIEFDGIASMPGISKDLLAQALVNRGIIKGQSGDSQGAIADYTAVVELAGAPADEVAIALFSRGATLGNQNNHERALEDFDAALALEGVSENQRSSVLISRGVALLKLDRRTQAIQDFEHCLESKAKAETVHRAFVLLTGAFLQDDRLPDAVNLVARLHEIEPAGAPVERRLEVRITAIVNAAKKHSLDAAATLLETAMMHDLEDIRDRLGFLKPAIEFARTGSEQVLANLPDRERDAAREIAASFLEKESRRDHKDPVVGPP
jgi:tetratricopeptide (TPR) repeat protein